MSNIVPLYQKEEDLLLKLKNSPEIQFTISEKPLLELAVKSKNLITFKLRFIKIYEKFILIFKSKAASKAHSIIFFEPDLKVEWLQHFALRLSKGVQCVDFYIAELKDCPELMRILNLKCNLLNFHGNYKAIKKIGKGSFASVYLVTKKDSENRYAVKSFNKEHICTQDKGKASLLNEIKIMRLLHHTNIITLHEVYETDNSYYMIMEMLEGGSLRDKISKEKLDLKVISSILIGILKGLSHMHKNGIMHRDIKPENILFRSNKNGEEDVCIADLGLSTFVNEKEHLFSRCGTPGFVAPEIINSNEETSVYNEKCDLFSLGVIYHLLLLGKSPFDSSKYHVVLKRNKSCKIDFGDSFYDNLQIPEKTLLMKLLESDPIKRPTAEQALHEIYLIMASLTKKENNFETKPEKVSSSPLRKQIELAIKTPELKKNPLDSNNSNEVEERNSIPFIMRTVVMNGLSNTIEGLPQSSETEEKHTKLKRGLTIKIYRYHTMDIQSPNMIASLENSFKVDDKKTPETLPEANCNNKLLSIKENEEEEEKRNA